MEKAIIFDLFTIDTIAEETGASRPHLHDLYETNAALDLDMVIVIDKDHEDGYGNIQLYSRMYTAEEFFTKYNVHPNMKHEFTEAIRR